MWYINTILQLHFSVFEVDAYKEVSLSKFCIRFSSPHIPAHRSDDRNYKPISEDIPRYTVL
jgi:hypothetical protein